MLELKRGLIQVYTGDGKGKTTAALGSAFRAAGHGLKTIIIQFMKGTGYSGELFAAPRLQPSIKIESFGRSCMYASLIKEGYMDCKGCGNCFIKQGEATEEDHFMARKALERVQDAFREDWNLVIMDEVNMALYFELLRLEEILHTIEQKPAKVELILTGRKMPDIILEKADLVTKMEAVKHPYETGVSARWGIEY
ncbi:MAG: cob(I)yrinic acid a,c-diamide adenosyltransferase [Halanaerobium sp.]|nr:cob(I)yrinic acid a,c-diamide adenosyltransferase [Halanaerobium sp.]